MYVYNYVDKHGNPINMDDMISVSGGEPEKVYLITDQFGKDDLGINASNEEYLKNHPDAVRQYYSLNNFAQSELEVISQS